MVKGAVSLAVSKPRDPASLEIKRRAPFEKHKEGEKAKMQRKVRQPLCCRKSAKKKGSRCAHRPAFCLALMVQTQ
jgi:hypothetical protein